jgi:prolipoprotein diacylglyceryltransferase
LIWERRLLAVKMIMNKKGIIGEVIKRYLLWIVLLIIAGAAVYFLLKKLTG